MENFKKMRKIRKTKNYKRIANETRERLVHLVYEENMSIKDAAKFFKMNYSTAKTIIRIYRIEKRALKKNAEEEKILKRILISKNSQRTEIDEAILRKKRKLTVTPKDASTGVENISNENSISIVRRKVLLKLAQIQLTDGFREIESLCLLFFNYMEDFNDLQRLGFNETKRDMKNYEQNKIFQINKNKRNFTDTCKDAKNYFN
jgi:transposase